MAGVAEGQPAAARIQHAGERGDEERLGIVAADLGIGARQDRRRIAGIAQRNAFQQRFRQRHEQARRQAFARDVAHQEKQALAIEHEAVVEVAADGARRLEQCFQRKSLLVRKQLPRRRQQSHLDAARGLELARDARLRFAQRPAVPIGLGEC